MIYKTKSMFHILCIALVVLFVNHVAAQILPPLSSQHRTLCPINWVRDEDSSTSFNRDAFTCYKFVRSPKKSYEEAQALCQTYGADLLTINSNAEHGFIVRYLNLNDLLYRTWYIGVVQKSLGYWENKDGSQLLEETKTQIFRDQATTINKRYLGYDYSYLLKKWGLRMTDGVEPREFICKITSNKLGKLVLDSEEIRDYEYGRVVLDPRTIPRGPRFIKQPENAMFDLLKSDVVNHVSITCLADGYPAPSYSWYKEGYKNSKIQSIKIEPLKNSRFTVSGGTLIINKPKEIDDRGKYSCIAENVYGSVVSESVQIKFAYMAEFNLERSDDFGNQNWGKAIYCDPPRFSPNVRFYWNRDFFPNFVDEDKRTFVSYDGNLYFSYLDNIDEGRYSCTVQSTVSDIGRHGPFFKLDVLPHPNYQQLKFANTFPKAFPDSPIRGDDVRMECIAFGYPVPSYNWTRRNGPLPRGAQLLNNNRVLLLPDILPKHMGDYVCKAQNNRLSIEGTVSLSIQATPQFTIPLHDLFISEGEDVMMECEAFAIPDVDYSWLKNSKLLNVSDTPDMQERYTMKDNILRIASVTKKDEATFQCKATNQLSSSYSSAELKVLKVAPSFRKRPLEPERFAAIRTNITIKCSPEAAPAPDFEWRKDGLKLGRGGRIDILRNGDLFIKLVHRDDRGLYNCTATNIYGSDSSAGRLIVLDEPYFTTHSPLEIISSVGQSLHLQCSVVMDEILDLSYVWRHNDLRIQVDKQESKDHYYKYDHNLYSDFFDRRKQDDQADLRARQEENEAFGYIIQRQPPYRRGETLGDLLIQNLTLEDAGYYLCDAKTPIANISYLTKLIVYGPPGPPGGISALELTATNARIRWTDGSTNGSPVRLHTIEGKTTYTEKWTLLAENITAEVINEVQSRMEYQLPPLTLTPFASYKFRVRGINELGAGTFSHASPTANTMPDVPFKPPSKVGGGGGKTGDLTIVWEPLPEQDQNGPDVSYIVYWRKMRDEGDDRPPELFRKEILKSRGNTNMFVATIPRENFYTLHEVKVQSANRIGIGITSNISVIYSAEDMPQVQPTEVKAFAHNATSMNITWRSIEPTRDNIRGELIGYRLKYWRESDNETAAQIRLNNGTLPHGLVVGLVPNTFYWVRVMAYNSAGSGPESEKFRERTWRYPPLTPPNAVEVHPVDPETIYVKWRGISPTHMEEALFGYKVRIWMADQDMTTANDTIVPLGQSLEAYLGGLQIGKMYKLRVLAFSLGGDGKMSSPTWHFSMGDPEKLRSDAPIVYPIDSFVSLLLLAVSTTFVFIFKTKQ